MRKILLLMSVFFLVGFAEPITDPLAKPYVVVAQWNDGTTKIRDWGGSQRHIEIMAETAHSRDELAHTAMAAAKDVYKPGLYDVVMVHLIPAAALSQKGYDLATVSYAPDGRGYTGKEAWVWDASVATLMPSPKDISVAVELYKIKREFTDADGNLNDKSENALVRKVAKNLKIPVKQVRLPSFFLEPYAVNF